MSHLKTLAVALPLIVYHFSRCFIYWRGHSFRNCLSCVPRRRSLYIVQYCTSSDVYFIYINTWTWSVSLHYILTCWQGSEWVCIQQSPSHRDLYEAILLPLFGCPCLTMMMGDTLLVQVLPSICLGGSFLQPPWREMTSYNLRHYLHLYLQYTLSTTGGLIGSPVSR